MQDEYALLDSGGGRKLERFGDVVLDRPVAHALWRPRTGDESWSEARGVYHRSDKGGGSWEWHGRDPGRWVIRYGGLSLAMKATPFGHTGLFPEQRENWGWIREAAGALGGDQEVLNLFAYTGGSTLAAAQGGARVCHVDSSRGAVDWARENARESDLEDAPVRWIVEDVTRYLGRELRRGRTYGGIILDPPSFGRGKKGEVFKIERDLPELLEQCRQLLGPEPGFLLLSCHSAGFSPRVLEQLLAEVVPVAEGELEVGEMVVPQEDGRCLPSGFFARWRRT